MKLFKTIKDVISDITLISILLSIVSPIDTLVMIMIKCGNLILRMILKRLFLKCHLFVLQNTTNLHSMK